MSPPDGKKAFNLDGIVPWGRRLDEYAAFFALEGEPRSWPRILDVGAGPSSFAAEATQRGGRVVAVDPIYRFGSDTIRARYATARLPMEDGLQRAADRFVWDFYPSPTDVLRRRDEAIQLFLEDYEWGRACSRYAEAALPVLPYGDDAFGLALVSHLLFLYAEELDAEFHVAALSELCRVAREVRVFPLIAMDGQPSPHVEPVSEALRSEDLVVERVPVPFEFQRGATEMLRLRGGD